MYWNVWLKIWLLWLQIQINSRFRLSSDLYYLQIYIIFRFKLTTDLDCIQIQINFRFQIIFRLVLDYQFHRKSFLRPSAPIFGLRTPPPPTSAPPPSHQTFDYSSLSLTRLGPRYLPFIIFQLISDDFLTWRLPALQMLPRSLHLMSSLGLFPSGLSITDGIVKKGRYEEDVGGRAFIGACVPNRWEPAIRISERLQVVSLCARQSVAVVAKRKGSAAQKGTAADRELHRW